MDEIVGCGRGRRTSKRPSTLGVIDRYTHDIGEAVRDADMVFLAVPLGAMRETFDGDAGDVAGPMR